ncbi:MAG: hypothetical protein M9938_00320 [Solirubrobacterales bacterium]|nr:hypothetical protein [Solirubrobacterales bacterium]
MSSRGRRPDPTDSAGPAGPEVEHRLAWRTLLIATVPIAAALYLGIVTGVFAQLLSIGVTALILGLPLAVGVGLLVGWVSSQGAAAIEEGSGLGQVREALVTLGARPDPEQPERFELLHSGLGPDPSPGDVAVINLARRLADRGHRPRLVVIEGEIPRRDWRDRLAASPEVGPYIRYLETVFPGGNGGELVLNPADRLIATDWRAAHTADALSLELGGLPFTHLIREYAPFRYAMGSFAALADAAYELPHRAVFLDRLLMKYFADQRLGVFAAGPRLGLREAVATDEPTLPVRPRSAGQIAGTDRPRLLISSRPEEDGSGNMYDLAILALDRAVLNGHFRSWDLAAIGIGGEQTAIILPRSSARLRVLPEQAAVGRAAMLPEFDVGVALRYSPGLGPVPVEMAAAGMSVVTSTFGGKDEVALGEISPNLIPAEPRIEEIVNALGEAERRSVDHAGRIEGSAVAWPASWDEAFDDRTMSVIEGLASRR